MNPSSELFMDGLFASQSTSESQKILVYPDGKGYNIHLQVSGILQRPNLVRMLRKAGAHPSRPEDADIILVDSSQVDGKRLIRTWHHTPGKTVLEFQWLRKSIEAGRPLLEDDNWAGAQTVDDGEAIVIDEIVADGEEAEVEQIVSKLVSRPEGVHPLIPSIRSPLPTPRVTPDELFAQRQVNNIPAAPAVSADLPSTLNDPIPNPPQPQSPLVDIPQQQPPEHGAAPLAYNHAPSISSHHTSNNTQPTSLPPQFISVPSYNSQTSPQTQLAQSAAPAPFPHDQFAQVPQFSQPQFSQLAQFPQQFSIAQQPYQFNQLLTQQMPSGQMPLMPQTMMMPTGLPFSNFSNQQSFSMLMTLMDVLRNKGGGEFMQAGQPSPILTQVEAAPSVPPPIHDERTTVSTFAPETSPSSSYKSRSKTPDSTTSHRLEKKSRHAVRRPRSGPYTQSPSPGLLQGSVKSKINHEVVRPNRMSANKRSSKGKERALTPNGTTSDEDFPTNLDDSLEVPVSQRRTIIAERNPGEVFIDDQGQPLSFFVQVDLQGRSGVVSNVKKYKGRITGSIADANYVILFTRSQTFQGLLSEAQACNKVPIQSTFVTDCIAENALLDITDYALDTAVSIGQGKRGRPGGLFKFAYVESPVKQEKKAKKPDAKKTTPMETPVKKVEKRSTAPSSQKVRSSRVLRSPTPPPLESRKVMKGGRFHFTQAELDYFCRYAQFLLDEDPTLSTTALIQAVHKKMPHHPVASWQGQISIKLKTQLTDIRKRVNHKGMAGRVEKLAEEEKPSPSKKPRLAPSSTIQVKSQEALEREDFEVICQYFANGGGEDDNDERVWAKLSQYRPCKSAESWPEYYMAHQSEVYAHIEELVHSSNQANKP